MLAINHFHCFLAVSVIVMANLIPSPVLAGIVVGEQFIYEAGANIDDENGGFGFDGPWVANISHGRKFEVQSEGLSLPSIPGAGKALSRYGSSGRAEAHRKIAAAAREALTRDNTTIWFSALFQEPNSSYKHTSFLFGNEDFTTGGTPELDAPGEGFGFTIQRAPDGASQGTGTINALAFDNAETPIVVEGTFTPSPIDATSLIVGKINWKSDGSPDAFYLFNCTDLPSEPSEETAFAAITDLELDQSSFNSVALWDSNNGIIDEIRFGTTYESVVSNEAWADLTVIIVNELLAALNELKDHVTGDVALSDSQIEAHKATVTMHDAFFGHNEEIISACLGLVEAYDTEIGPLFVEGSPVRKFTRSSAADDIHWTVYHVMQSIMDRIYTDAILAEHEALLDGFKFGSSAFFPGSADQPPDPDAIHTAIIDASYLETWGHTVMHESRPARKPTGTYLAPGSIATVTVPPSLVGKNIQVRVGAHSWDFSNKPSVKRMDRCTLVYSIDSVETRIASPLGGGIYIEVPEHADEGIVEVQIRNAIRSPYFSAKSFHATTMQQWQDEERHYQAPWADFQSEKFMMQVPRSWIYDLDDPVTLMQDWDMAMEAMDDLMGYPSRTRESMYQQVDLYFRASVFAPGYPTVNNKYDPDRDYGGDYSHYLLRGPQHAAHQVFHEEGHGYLFQKFPGETESNVNLLHVAVWHRKFGYDLDTAFRSSLGYDNEHRTLDNTAVTWMTVFNFSPREAPMADGEKAYQLKGHAKFVDMARLFGWQVLDDYWYSFNEDHENDASIDTSIDGLLLRLSRAAGVDIRPLFHFWGVHPQDPAGLAADIEAANLPASSEIHDTLLHYKSLVPADNQAFQAFALNWWGEQPSINGYWTEREHARQWDDEVIWDNQVAPNGEIYDETSSARIKAVVDGLIDRYFARAFRRGDINADGNVDLSDAISLLTYLFRDAPDPSCLDAADANHDKAIDLSDAITVLMHLFGDTGNLSDPFEACGLNPGEDGLGCLSFPPCD